jgi:hypothetical protein
LIISRPQYRGGPDRYNIERVRTELGSRRPDGSIDHVGENYFQGRNAGIIL